jgi:hypothetical protein
MTETTPFELSRIYASGWNAGRQHPLDEADAVAEAAERLNPWQGQDERARWSKGFTDAVSRQSGAPRKSWTRQRK